MSGDGSTVLQGSVPIGQTWVLGNANPQGYQSGKLYQINRPAGLVSNNRYFTTPAPQYEKYDIGQIMSLKNDPDYPVYGDSKLYRSACWFQ
jgi:glucan 1,3-beta-glucosidase